MKMAAVAFLISALPLSSCAGLDRWGAGVEQGDGDFGPWSVHETRYKAELGGPIKFGTEERREYDARADMLDLNENVKRLVVKVEKVEASQQSILNMLKEWAGPGTLVGLLAYLGWQKTKKKE